jgi:ketosteroid isomerase-like protein
VRDAKFFVIQGHYMRPSTIARRFVQAINAHDLDAICGLTTEGHRFIDSLGAVVEGREAMRVGWSHYFRMVPDYAIQVERDFESGPLVVLFGSAGGTYTPDGVLREEGRWSAPAALYAVVEGEHVSEWRVYADNEPIRRRMAELAKTRAQ